MNRNILIDRQLRMADCPPTGTACSRLRKQYAPPELVVYGSLVDLTRSFNDPPLDADFGGSINTS
ncbi:MAG TPA: lasso RiPP family leader peptide-containing protein [Thermoanaerobaculia bacterium]|nr:lasso RiPP family leader peptide-containing protein [Thermoanaerobaculia bacterium]